MDGLKLSGRSPLPFDAAAFEPVVAQAKYDRGGARSSVPSDSVDELADEDLEALVVLGLQGLAALLKRRIPDEKLAEGAPLIVRVLNKYGVELETGPELTLGVWAVGAWLSSEPAGATEDPSPTENGKANESSRPARQDPSPAPRGRRIAGLSSTDLGSEPVG